MEFLVPAAGIVVAYFAQLVVAQLRRRSEKVLEKTLAEATALREEFGVTLVHDDEHVDAPWEEFPAPSEPAGEFSEPEELRSPHAQIAGAEGTANDRFADLLEAIKADVSAIRKNAKTERVLNLVSGFGLGIVASIVGSFIFGWMTSGS